MKRFLIIIIFLCALPALAANRITALVAITNAAGTTNGQTITLSGDVRTWTNTVVVSSTQILTNSTPDGAKTNLYKQIGLNPFSQVIETDAGITNLNLIGNSGVNITVTLSAGWGTVTYSTQIVATAVAVRIPTSIEQAAEQTNINSGLLAAIRDNSDTNVLYESTPAMANFVGQTNSGQIISGSKIFTGSSNYLAGAYLSSPIFTNAVNYGNAFSSQGTAAQSEQFGASSIASGAGSLSIGAGATARGGASTAVGTSSGSLNTNDSAFGTASIAIGTNSTALGAWTKVNAGHTNSTAIGFGASSTAANQILLGGSGINSVVQNALSVGAGATFVNGISNLWLTGTNTLPSGADIAFGRYALATLVNGNNNPDIVVGTNVFVEVSGPSAAFGINGIAGGRNGKFVIIVNRTGFAMTVLNESGGDGTAANRIQTMTGGDRSTTGNGAVMLIYNASASRWQQISLEPVISSGSDSGAWHVGGDGLGGAGPFKLGPVGATDFQILMSENCNPSAVVMELGTLCGNDAVNMKLGASNTIGSVNFGSIILGNHNATAVGVTWSTIIGGGFNSIGANGNAAIVLGGATNSANNNYSVAGGQGMTTANNNTFGFNGIPNLNVTTSANGTDEGVAFWALQNGIVLTNSGYGQVRWEGTAVKIQTNLMPIACAPDFKMGIQLFSTNNVVQFQAPTNVDATGKFYQKTRILLKGGGSAKAIIAPANCFTSSIPAYGIPMVTNSTWVTFEVYPGLTNMSHEPIN